MPSHKALFLTGPLPVTAAAMRGWLDAGNEISACWMPLTLSKGFMHRDQRLAVLAPQWSMTSLIKRHGIPVRGIPRLATWDERMEAVRRTGADVLICAYFPYLIPEDMLAYFKGRAVNLHPAPLPQYRGPTPTEAMILDRTILTESAMTLHLLDSNFDTGAIVARHLVPFRGRYSPAKFELAMAKAARKLMGTELPDYLAGRITAVPQDERLADYPRIGREDLALGAHLDIENIIWRCQMLAQRRPLDVQGIDCARVIGVLGWLGPATGAPPQVRLLHIDMDAADGRVRLKRKRPWSSALRKLNELRIRMIDRDTD